MANQHPNRNRTKGIHLKLHASELAEVTEYQHAKRLRSPGAAVRRMLRLKATQKIEATEPDKVTR